ncbi:MAG: ThuA domain-containing protein [Fulvivirga sp.]
MRNSISTLLISIKQAVAFFLVPSCILFSCDRLKEDSPSGKAENFAMTSGQNSAKKNNTQEVQVFLPGFSVRQLPVSLSDINVVRYGPDGLLYALAYSGHIYRLMDTNGDGLEDKAEKWWDKDPLVSPIGMIVSDVGVFVTSKNKISLLKDTDKDGKADTEDIVISDWEKSLWYTGTSAGGVDAMGIARDIDGNIFFALGTPDYRNAYLIDSLGKAHYSLESERGTVLKVSADGSKKEIFCTGTRFLVAMAFNKEGDLFATEQEGATWLPNGNPYDELLHIQEDRHYGFPPRHPEHLPDVIDEPSTYDYKPQHQSTTGLNFNTPINNGAIFGPTFWENDAIVTGYSRGKIYRTKLVKTPAGYVAQNNIIASVSALTVDACTSPTGALVIATHAGYPDWGYGPKAEGKLYKVIYSNRKAAVPVAAWTPKPDQVKIAFDKPLDREYLADLVDKIEIEFGVYVEAGDRFEVLRPGYRAVERQQSFPRQKLKVKTAELSHDRRTLILNSFTHNSPVTYGITLPAFDDDEKIKNSIAQVPAIDLAYKLNGVEVNWQSDEEEWKGWMPHLDLTVNNALMKSTSEFDELNKMLQKPGKLTLKTKLNLWNMLRPDTQPESNLDYKLPQENVSLIFRSSAPLEIIASLANVSGSVKKGEFYETTLAFKAVTEQAYAMEIVMETTTEKAMLGLHFFTNEDARPRALPLHRLFVPWVENIFSDNEMQVAKNLELAGGNWDRGKQIFYNEGACSTCHSVGGEGKSIGPNLSNLIYRDYTSVFRDISEPSAAIEPDYLAHTVTLKNSEQMVGMVSYKKDSMVIPDIADNRVAVSLQDVKNATPLAASLMPAGLDKALGEQKMKDLMTFLLTSLKPAVYNRDFGTPQIRKVSEVKAVLNEVEYIKNKPNELLKILWVSGPKDHGPDAHGYPLQQKRWAELFALADNVAFTAVSKWPTQNQFDNADVIVFFRNDPDFNEDKGKQLDTFLQKGGGLVYLHAAIDATANPKALADRIGYAWKSRSSKFRHGWIDLNFSEEHHPITEGFDKVSFKDESYWELVKGTKEVNVLATVTEDGAPKPMLWTATAGRGRIFVSVPGHFNWTFDDPLFRVLLLRGIAWTGHQSTNRFNDIVTMGARVSK